MENPERVRVVEPELLDRIYRAYSEEEGFENTLLRYKIREVLPWVRGPRALDIGCGVGVLCRVMAESVDQVVGVDGSPAKIARARELNAAANIEYVCELFDDWTPDAPFQTIVATNVVEHVPDAVEFLSRCRSMLTPGGRMVISVPNAVGLHKRIGMEMGLIEDYFALTRADLEKGHTKVYDRARLEADLRGAGFDVEHSGGILLKPLSHRQMEAWAPELVDALYEVGKQLPDYCSSVFVVGLNQDSDR